MRQLDIHEDFDGLIYLALADNCVAYPGYTWDIGGAQVYSPGDRKVTWASLGVRAVDVERVVARYFPAYDAVTTGYFTYRTPLENTTAFGDSDTCVVFVERDGERKLSGIWFMFGDLSEQEETALITLLKELAGFGNFLFEDNLFQCKPDDEALLQLYFAYRHEQENGQADVARELAPI